MSWEMVSSFFFSWTGAVPPYLLFPLLHARCQKHNQSVGREGVVVPITC